MAGRERPVAVGAKLGGGRRAADEEEAGTSTSLSSSTSSSASIHMEMPAPMTGPAGEEEAEVEVELSGLVGKRRRSLRMLDQLGDGGGGDDIEAGAGGTGTEAPGGDESSDSGSGMSMSPDTCYHVNQRSIGSRKPKMLQDIKTHGGSFGFDNIPTPPSLRSQKTKLISENTSYYRWAEEEGRYLDPARLTAPWSQENACLLLSSLAVATTSAFFAVPIAFYVIEELKLDAAATNIAQQMIALPQAFQVPIGLLTDCVPVRKRRRKYYILAGWLMYIVAMAALAFLGDPQIDQLVGLCFMSFFGAQLLDLAQRALIVQRSRFEAEDSKGQLLVNYNLAWTWGSMIGNIMGTFCYKDNFQHGGGMSLGNIAAFGAAVNVALLPALYWLFDPKVCSVSKTRPIREELADVWAMVQRRSVLLPMLFVGLFQAFWIPNSAWPLFLIRGLSFSEWQIGLLGLMGAVLGAVGAALYRFCLMRVNWRSIFVVTSIIMALTNCLQLMLVFGVNRKWGISDFFFACGDSLVESFVDGFHMMPISIMYLGLCPGGAEGTALAALQTFVSLAVMTSNNIGLLFLRLWDVSAEAIARHNYDGVWKITLLCALLQLVGIFFVRLMPRSAKHQEEKQSFDQTLFWGGVAFVAFTVVAFFVTIGLDVSYMLQGF